MKWLIALFSLPLLLLAGALVLNRAPLWEPPGVLARLQLYLTTNVAQTRVDHIRPELRPLRLRMPQDRVQELVLDAMHRLNWRQIQDRGRTLDAVVVTPLLGFKDDIEISLESTSDGVLIQARSRSRIGKGDLAANTRHILDLYRMLERLRG